MPFQEPSGGNDNVGFIGGSPNHRPSTIGHEPSGGDDNVGYIGSLGCPGVDGDAWQRANRAPVFAGKTNRWLLAASVRAGANDADLMNDLHALFWTWFAEGSSDNRIWIFADTEFEAGNADNVQIVKATPDARRLETSVARREDLPGPTPALAGAKQTVYVEVTFSYRGQLTDVPWVTFSRSAWTKAGKTCPAGADWVLLDVGAASGDAPAARSLAEKVVHGTASTVKEVAQGLASGLGFTGVLTIGLGVALALWLSNRVK